MHTLRPRYLKVDILAIFPIDAEKARAFLPKTGIHPLRLGSKGMLVVSVIDYRETTIGKYIEYSIGIACTCWE